MCNARNVNTVRLSAADWVDLDCARPVASEQLRATEDLWRELNISFEKQSEGVKIRT